MPISVTGAVRRTRAESASFERDVLATARAGVELLVALLLLYSFFAVPIQLSVWVTDDVCSLPPTQHFDMTTEVVFIVVSPRPTIPSLHQKTASSPSPASQITNHDLHCSVRPSIVSLHSSLTALAAPRRSSVPPRWR